MASLALDEALHTSALAERNVDRAELNAALKIVHAFIIERGLILYGGLAIDFALRRKKRSLYADDELPDYDFYSKTNVDDASELARILHRKNFTNVSAIRRLHVQTMSVRVNFVSVADISYVPQRLFDEMLADCVTHGPRAARMNVVNPHRQMMDMHLALSLPFLDPPREAIFNRMEKDVKRYNMLWESYPIEHKPVALVRAGGASHTSRAAASPIAATVPLTAADGSPVGDFALFGPAALALLRGAAEKTENPRFVVEVERTELAKTGTPALEIRATFPDGYPYVDILAADPVALVAACAPLWPGSPPEWREPFLDAVPASCVVGPLRVFSSRDRRFTVWRRSTVAAASIQPILALMLGMHYASSGAPESARADYLGYYALALQMTAAAVKAMTSAEEFLASPFSPMLTVIDTPNESSSHKIKIAQSSKMMGVAPPANYPPLADLPENFYPERAAGAAAAPPFDYSRNPLFARSGAPAPLEKIYI